MAKIKSKVTKEQVEKGASRDFEEPQPGRYAATVHTCEVEGKKANKKIKQLHVAYQIDADHDKYGGAVVHERVPLPEDAGGDMHDRSEWKYSQFLQAMQLIDSGSKKKVQTVEFDTDDLEGTPVILRVKAGDYNGDYRAEVGTVLPRLDDEDVDEDEDAEELDEDELDEDDFGDEDEDEDELEEEEELTADDINAMGADELKALMAEYELKKPKAVKGVKGVRAWLIEELELEGEEDEDEDDPF
jgi:hypothetical protein